MHGNDRLSWTTEQCFSLGTPRTRDGCAVWPDALRFDGPLGAKLRASRFDAFDGYHAVCQFTAMVWDADAGPRPYYPSVLNVVLPAPTLTPAPTRPRLYGRSTTWSIRASIGDREALFIQLVSSPVPIRATACTTEFAAGARPISLTEDRL